MNLDEAFIQPSSNHNHYYHCYQESNQKSNCESNQKSNYYYKIATMYKRKQPTLYNKILKKNQTIANQIRNSGGYIFETPENSTAQELFHHHYTKHKILPHEIASAKMIQQYNPELYQKALELAKKKHSAIIQSAMFASAIPLDKIADEIVIRLNKEAYLKKHPVS